MSVDEKIAGLSGAGLAGVICQACPVHAPWIYTALGTSSTSGATLSAIYNKKHELTDFIHTNIRNKELPKENPVLYMDIIKNQELKKDYKISEIGTDISISLVAIPISIVAYKYIKNVFSKPKIASKINKYHQEFKNSYENILNKYK